MVEVRRLREGEGALVRELRLRALADAPYAFSSSLEREAAYPPEHWERLVGDPVFIAVEGAEWLGMAGGYLPRDEPGTGVLWGLWVAPGARRRGLACRLVEAVAGWAREHGLRRLELSVSDAEGSRPAAALYRELGFAPTGEAEPLESDPSLIAAVLARAP